MHICNGDCCVYLYSLLLNLEFNCNTIFSAEQKLRDKLAAAAREKMTQVTQNTKDKSLQAERKRKAAMFVSMLKGKQKGGSSEAVPAIIGKLSYYLVYIV